MIRKTNFKLNWKYALGEICLIFIGISLAIAFQNWNDQRRLRVKEKELLSQLKTDLNSLRSELGIDITYEKAFIAYTDSILLFDPSSNSRPLKGYFKRDSIFHYLNDVQLFPSTASYQNLKSMGLEIISASDIRHKLIDLYDRRLTRSREWELLVYGYAERIRNMAEEHFTSDKPTPENPYPEPYPQSYQVMIKNPEFMNAMIAYQRTRLTLVSRYESILKSVEELDSLLK